MKILIITLSLLFYSCSHPRSEFYEQTNYLALIDSCQTHSKSWIGYTKHDLIIQYGNSVYPEESDGVDGKIIMYSSFLYKEPGLWRNYDMCQQFYINKEGIIYRARCFIEVDYKLEKRIRGY